MHALLAGEVTEWPGLDMVAVNHDSAAPPLLPPPRLRAGRLRTHQPCVSSAACALPGLRFLQCLLRADRCRPLPLAAFFGAAGVRRTCTCPIATEAMFQLSKALARPSYQSAGSFLTTNQFHHHLLFMMRLDSLHRTYFVTCSVGLADVSSLRLRCSVREG